MGCWMLAVLMALAPARLQAQELPGTVLSVGAGGTYYCIVSRCDTGFVGRAGLGYSLSPHAMIEGGARWHDCFDCDRFVIGDAGLQLRREGARMTPFVAAGAGVSSDPEFMGTRWGPYAALGTWIALTDGWAAQVELRGRRVGSDSMGEVTASLARLLTRPGS